MKETVTLYLKHQAIAWPGVTTGCILLGIPPIQGALLLFGVPNGAPVFAGWLLAGGTLGYLINRKDCSWAACLVFFPPLAVFLWGLWVALHATVDGGWTGMWTAYFSNNCGASECMDEGFLTAPLYACVAYSLAAWLALRRGGAQTSSAGVSGQTG